MVHFPIKPPQAATLLAMPGGADPPRKPVALPSKKFSCSELQAGQAVLKQAKLEPTSADEKTAALRQRLQASCFMVICETTLNQP